MMDFVAYKFIVLITNKRMHKLMVFALGEEMSFMFRKMIL